MSTRSYICIEQKDGTYKGSYCHSDGYLTYNGAMLIDHYQDRDKVEKLISYGDMSSLCENVDPNPNKPHSFDDRQEDVTVFYGRDRGEKNTEARIIKLEDINSPDSWIEHCYIYGLDNKWKYFECGKLEGGLKDLNESLDKEYEAMGFKRVPGYYGFYTSSDIEVMRNNQDAEAEM